MYDQAHALVYANIKTSSTSIVAFLKITPFFMSSNITNDSQPHTLSHIITFVTKSYEFKLAKMYFCTIMINKSSFYPKVTNLSYLCCYLIAKTK